MIPGRPAPVRAGAGALAAGPRLLLATGPATPDLAAPEAVLAAG